MGLIAKFRAWRAARAEAHRQARYDKGWVWAAGELLKGEKPKDVLATIDCAALFESDKDAFDAGARAAVLHWLGLSLRKRK